MQRHLDSKIHLNTVKSLAEKELEASKLKSKNQKAGMNIGYICMKIFQLGRPYTYFEIDVLLLKKSGAIVGELNHSRRKLS